MSRATNNVASRNRRKKILDHAKGFYGGLSKQYRQAVERVHRAWVFAFRDRKVRKRAFRALWIARINAAARQNDITYSVLMNKLRVKNIGLDRKVLADIAYHEPETFKRIVDSVR